jgi:dynein heavy chain
LGKKEKKEKGVVIEYPLLVSLPLGLRVPPLRTHPRSLARPAPAVASGAMAEERPPDARVNWIQEKVCGLLRCKTELFQKLMGLEAEGDLILRFCNDESTRMLFFGGGAKEMTVWDKFPASYKKKVVYLLKPAEVKLDEKKLELLFEQVVVGDLNAGLLESLHGTLRDVYLPLFTNPKNTRSWPEVATKVVMDRYHSTVASVFVAIGQTAGKTVLALPPAEILASTDKASGAKTEKQDKDRVHILESAVIMWTDRIQNALARRCAMIQKGEGERWLGCELARCGQRPSIDPF